MLRLRHRRGSGAAQGRGIVPQIGTLADIGWAFSFDGGGGRRGYSGCHSSRISLTPARNFFRFVRRHRARLA